MLRLSVASMTVNSRPALSAMVTHFPPISQMNSSLVWPAITRSTA